MFAYPCNVRVLRAALNVIVHSDNSRKLARDWYGPAAADRWQLIPHMRVAVQNIPRTQAREALGLDRKSFVVCSFGLLGPTKLNDRLLSAWLASDLANDGDCVLVFVGENAGGEYGAALRAAIAASPASARIRITGWADSELYQQYLAAADVGVQLRSHSRGETSGTVLDCMNYGLATIVNAHGSLADLPEHAVCLLDDQFDDAALAAALQRLHRDPGERARLGAVGREMIRTVHAPRRCADAYAEAIESAYREGAPGAAGLIAAVAQLDPGPADEGDLAALAQALAECLPPRLSLPQKLFEVDLKAAGGDDASLVHQLLAPRDAERVELVYLDKSGQYRYARQFALKLLGCPLQAMQDEIVDFRHGDTLVALAETGKRAHRLKELQTRGVHILPASKGRDRIA